MGSSSSRLSYGVDSASTAHASRVLIRDDTNAPPTVQRDLHVARTTRSNLLLVGRDHVVTRLLPFAIPDLTQAAITRCKNGSLRLPHSSMRPSTVVIRDVDVLTHGEQRMLCEWLQSRGADMHVVSTASAPLLPLVERSAFNAALYYRLNMIYIELSE
jgi:hypothetical protein